MVVAAEAERRVGKAWGSRGERFGCWWVAGADKAAWPEREGRGKIGELLIIGFDGTEMTPRIASLLSRVQPAGVILFARNITGTEQTYRLLRDCQKHVAT